MVLAWRLHQRPEICPIVGVSSVEQLDSAMAAGTVELDEQTLRDLARPH